MQESVRSVLEELERQLQSRVDALRRELEPLERELSDVRKAKSALAPRPTEAAGSLNLSEAALHEAPEPYRSMTMKQLIRAALREQFPNGATANQLLDFFAHSWSRRDIVRSSLSPQLSRLRWDKEIDRNGYRWFLVDQQTPGLHKSKRDPTHLVKSLDGQPVVVRDFADDEVLVRIGNEDRRLSPDEWESLPLWSGPSPFACKMAVLATSFPGNRSHEARRNIFLQTETLPGAVGQGNFPI